MSHRASSASVSALFDWRGNWQPVFSVAISTKMWTLRSKERIKWTRPLANTTSRGSRLLSSASAKSRTRTRTVAARSQARADRDRQDARRLETAGGGQACGRSALAGVFAGARSIRRRRPSTDAGGGGAPRRGRCDGELRRRQSDRHREGRGDGNSWAAAPARTIDFSAARRQTSAGGGEMLHIAIPTTFSAGEFTPAAASPTKPPKRREELPTRACSPVGDPRSGAHGRDAGVAVGVDRDARARPCGRGCVFVAPPAGHRHAGDKGDRATDRASDAVAAKQATKKSSIACNASSRRGSRFSAR